RPAENGAADSALVVDAITLNDIFNLTNIDHINFLKVDCEGAEFDIFLNTNAVELNRIDHICLEYHDNATSHHHSALVNHFKYYGFEVKTQQNQVHSHLGFLYAQRSKP
ncbi:MAG: FkbM family methyltransferase, partial [Chloroflexota bacterium]